MMDDLADTAVIWCWQLPTAAPIGVVRLVCARNAFTTVATESKHPDVRSSLIRLGSPTATRGPMVRSQIHKFSARNPSINFIIAFTSSSLN